MQQLQSLDLEPEERMAVDLVATFCRRAAAPPRTGAVGRRAPTAHKLAARTLERLSFAPAELAWLQRVAAGEVVPDADRPALRRAVGRVVEVLRIAERHC